MAANTNGMRNLLQKICSYSFSLALLFATACAPSAPENSLEPLPQNPAEIPLESIPAPVQEFWDTEDTDISFVDEKRNHIAFTFDDSPSKTLERIVGVFLDYNRENPDCPACCTVFSNCIYLNEHTLAPLQAAFAAGFELGNHSYSHKNLAQLEKEELLWELEENDRLLQGIDGKPLHLLRAPYGSVNAQVKELSKTPVIDWNIDTLDWTGKTEEEIYQTVFSEKSDGAIVLMHDGYEHTVEALKKLLPDLKEAGYQVVSVSQLSKIHRCPLRIGGLYTRARRKTS